ncbi:hypothetical protein P7C71_g4145, partial [Lecanoromycetidae sp. Uapishka_2]
MLDWEQFRLEQWAEKAGLQDPAKADILMDWKLITTTLQHIQNLTNDTEVLKDKYKLILLDRAPHLGKMVEGEEDEKASMSRFKRLFGQPDRFASSAAGKVIHSKNSASRKLWWAAVDKENMQRLITDISHFVQRLHDLLDFAMQAQMQKSIDLLLHEATERYSDVPDLEYLRELAVRARDPPDHESSGAENVAEEVERKFRNRLFHSIRKGEIKEVESLLETGVGVQVDDNVGWPPLVRAAEHGQLAIAELLLARGANPLIGTIGDRLPLHFAAEEGHEPVVRLLLKLPDIDVNKKDYTGQTALFKAAHHGKPDVVRLLLQQRGIEPDCVSNDGFTPLITSVFEKHTEVTRLLLERPDVDPNLADTSYKQTPLWMAATAGLEMLKLFLAREDIEINGRSRWLETPLFQAIQRDRLPEAKLLLDAKADPNVPNSQEHTPLYWTAENGKEVPMELLLAQPNILVDAPDKLAQTPLSRAATKGHVKCVRLLLAKDAKVESADKEEKTPLHLAAASGHKVVAKILLKSKANINAQDKTGNTPLALAAAGNHDAVVRYLLESGADADLPDEDEETPFEKARDKHMDQIIEVFKEVLNLP